MKTVTCICVHPDGVLSLQLITLEIDIIGSSLEIPRHVFDCHICGRTCTGLGKQDPQYTKQVDTKTRHSFVLYYYDPHDDTSKCVHPYNMYTSALLNCACSGGYEEQHKKYRGCFYLLKQNFAPQQKAKINLKQGNYSYGVLEKHDTTVNCTKEDIVFVRGKLTQDHEQKQSLLYLFWSWCASKFHVL